MLRPMQSSWHLATYSQKNPAIFLQIYVSSSYSLALENRKCNL